MSIRRNGATYPAGASFTPTAGPVGSLAATADGSVYVRTTAGGFFRLDGALCTRWIAQTAYRFQQQLSRLEMERHRYMRWSFGLGLLVATLLFSLAMLFV